MSSAVLQAKEISKFFHDPYDIQVLKKINFEIQKGEFTSIIGKSGCGKSTLLYILSTMDTDYEGDLIIDDQLMRGKKEADLARVRNEKIGFVFQFHYLLNEFSVIKNVMLPGLKLSKLSAAEVEQNAYEKLKILGIQDEALKLPNQLSGGQKQRLALAAALVGRPEVLFLDEPSAGLDPQSRQLVFELIGELRDSGMGIILTTHLMDDAQRLADYVYIIDGGRNVAEGTVQELLQRGPAVDAGADHVRTLSFDATPGLDLSGVLPADVVVLEERAGSYTATGALTPKHLAALAEWWAVHDVMPAAMTLQARSLEDVFLDISGKDIR